MKGLIIAAHGSRKTNSNQEIIQLTGKVAKISKKQFDLVDCAFLQFSDPNLETVLAGMVEKGGQDIVVFPYFLGSGSHVTKDIPEIISSLEKQHPHVTITVTRHMGAVEKIKELILEEVTENK